MKNWPQPVGHTAPEMANGAPHRRASVGVFKKNRRLANHVTGQGSSATYLRGASQTGGGAGGKQGAEPVVRLIKENTKGSRLRFLGLCAIYGVTYSSDI